LSKSFEDMVTGAIVADESFAWPYWDDKLGPVLGEDEQGVLRRGEICVRTYTEQRGRLGAGRPVRAFGRGG
jgi:hypothetical protein